MIERERHLSEDGTVRSLKVVRNMSYSLILYVPKAERYGYTRCSFTMYKYIYTYIMWK